MAKGKKDLREDSALIAIPPSAEVEVLPPDSGVVGEFLDTVRKTFKARAMRMGGLMKRIDESGLRMEALLRTAAERAEAAETSLQRNLEKEGLLPENSLNDDDEE